MIARIYIFIILAIVLPDVYLYVRYLRKRTDLSVWLHALWWLPGVVMAGYTVGLSLIRDFAPTEIMWLNVYLFLTGIAVAPKVLFVACSLVGRLVRRVFGLKHNWGNYVGIVLVLFVLYMLMYGSTVGVRKFTVRHVDITFDELPDAFDGYRIVQFTDVHAGSIETEALERTVETINSLNADAVVFTGDLQNMVPDEIEPYAQTLASIRAKDGVYSVLGNHDYSFYIGADSAECAANERRLVEMERHFGWNVLLNEHRVVRRGTDSIVIAGEENGGKRRFRSRADIVRTLDGVAEGAFVVLLQHDPSAWRDHILPYANARKGGNNIVATALPAGETDRRAVCDVHLTLSGHTHGGQMSILGMRPTELTGIEDCGLYRDEKRALYVSSGVGGLVPFRFGVTPEVVVITLRKQK